MMKDNPINFVFVAVDLDGNWRPTAMLTDMQLRFLHAVNLYSQDGDEGNTREQYFELTGQAREIMMDEVLPYIIRLELELEAINEKSNLVVTHEDDPDESFPTPGAPAIWEE